MQHFLLAALGLEKEADDTAAAQIVAAVEVFAPVRHLPG